MTPSCLRSPVLRKPKHIDIVFRNIFSEHRLNFDLEHVSNPVQTSIYLEEADDRLSLSGVDTACQRRLSSVEDVPAPELPELVQQRER